MTTIAAGTIILWGDALIPTGWLLCDGTTASIPDLRGYFVRGASVTTGSGIKQEDWSTHTHTNPTLESKLAHTHTGNNITTSVPNTTALHTAFVGTPNYYMSTSTHTHTINSSVVASGAHTHTITDAMGSASNLPPYIKLYYIMKDVE